ncbi:MAG: N-6 DNA methylase, partial [Candidatus Aegiribacteria sp.]|nr:N-6 DNA methylase [Candidatus Aegiribacteria sp.]
YLLDAIRALSQVKENSGFRRTDFRNLGTEELGSIYESLLELHPHINSEVATFELEVASGHERKTTGSYYTPTSLINELLNSALEPVIDQSTKNSDNPEEAILNLKICDPACGSGHFLIAAAHRIAKRLAAIRTGEEEPAPEPYKTALRDVIGHCIYGVDINPMSVELCKVSLWLEALEPGKPLSFLDHHIKCGNSLLGTTPKLIENGIPDDAFKPITGDDKKVASQLRKKNKAERMGGQMTLGLDSAEKPEDRYRRIGYRVAEVDDLADTELFEIKSKEMKYSVIKKSEQFRQSKLLADAWCAAFVWRKTPGLIPPVTTDTIRKLEKDSNLIPIETREEVNRLADQYNFFHWHLEYPEVFYRDKEKNGFDVVLGNPPWEHTELKEKEYFASRNPEIANAPGAIRKKLIEQLKNTDLRLFEAFIEEKRNHDVSSHFVRTSELFPFCGRGRINTYAIFAELNRNLINGGGQVGCIVQSGIATDDTTKFFFQDLIENQSLVSLFDFENRKKIFPAIDSRIKFCLLTIAGTDIPVENAEFVFFALSTDDLKDTEKRFSLSKDDIELLNPNTKTCPIFRTRRDAEITKGIYRRVPVLINESDLENGNPWGITFKQGLFNMTSDSHLFRTHESLVSEGWTLEGNIFIKGNDKYMPLYEGKMIDIYDHRKADVVISSTAVNRKRQPKNLSSREKLQKDRFAQPHSWVPQRSVEEQLLGRSHMNWLMGWKDVTSPTNERTMIPCVIPITGVGHKIPLIMQENVTTPISATLYSCLIACLSSYIFDWCARQKVGGTSFTYFYLKQLPLLHPDVFQETCPWSDNKTVGDWISERVIELTYTSWDMKPFAEDCGFSGPPFTWEEERRFQLRCDLDAALFYLYGIKRDDVDYIMETFPIVRRKDEQKYGEYRTKRMILNRFISC